MNVLGFFLRAIGTLAMIMAVALGGIVEVRIVLTIFIGLMFFFTEMASMDLSIMRANLLAIIRQLGELLRERTIENVHSNDDGASSQSLDI